MSEDSPTLQELLEEVFEVFMAKYHGPMLARVESYDQAPQTVDCQPLVKIYYHGSITNMPILRSVPVQRPGGGNGALTFPLATGDVVQLVPQGVDVSAWVASGSINQDAPSRRRFSLADVVAIPRVRSKANPLPSKAYESDGAVLYYDGHVYVRADNDAYIEANNVKLDAQTSVDIDGSVSVNIDGATIKLGNPVPDDFAAKATLVLAELNAIRTAFQGHTHSGVAKGDKSTDGPSASIPTLGSVGSTKVHLE